MVRCPVPDRPTTACMIWRQTHPGQSTCLGHVTYASGVQGTIMTCGYRISTRVKYWWRAGGQMLWWCLIRKTITVVDWMYLFMDNKNTIKSWQSSAYIWYCSPCLLMILPRGNIYMVKRIGPNTDPWGTPQVNGMLFEFTPFIRTDCFLSERYDLNH